MRRQNHFPRNAKLPIASIVKSYFGSLPKIETIRTSERRAGGLAGEYPPSPPPLNVKNRFRILIQRDC